MSETAGDRQGLADFIDLVCRRSRRFSDHKCGYNDGPSDACSDGSLSFRAQLSEDNCGSGCELGDIPYEWNEVLLLHSRPHPSLDTGDNNV